MPTDTTQPLTNTELSQLTCQHEGCTHEQHGPLVMNSRCHRKKPTIVRYWGDGVIEIRCKVCNKFVGSIAIHPAAAAEMSAKIVCDDPSCKEPIGNHSLIMKPPCHPTSGAFVLYHAGHITIACGNCHKAMAAFHVKDSAAQA